MRVKICGITQIEQGQKITALGADSLGFICVQSSPRYVTPAKIRIIVESLPATVDKVGVFANSPLSEVLAIASQGKLTSIQLHGAESPQFCTQLRQALPQTELIKAFRIKDRQSLEDTVAYTDINTLLLDAYDPQMLGGTGKTINWQDLQQFRPHKPWLLAGGLNPENISDALTYLQPDGIDLSSGVERSPGDKDLDAVARLFVALSKLQK